MQLDKQFDIGILIAFERQIETLRETELILESNDRSRHEKAFMWEHDDYSDFMSASVQLLKDSNPDEPDPFPFKPRDPEGSFVCYLVAEFNYANGISICNLISDPKLKQKCLDKNRKAYCDAWELCGGGKK